MVLYVPPASPLASGSLGWTWIDPDGNEHDLTHETSPLLHVSRGSAGLGMPPVELVTEKLPTMPGGLVRYAQTRPLEINLPIQVRGTTFADLLGRVELLRSWFGTSSETSRTPGYLRVTRPQDDTQRQLACFYTGGLEGDLNDGGPTWAPLVVSLLAPDPYWTSVNDEEVVYGQSDLGTTLAVINSGDFDAYPVWTISGPASAITVTNLTTSKAFALTDNGGLSLAAASQLIVDTRPTSQRTDPQILHDGDSAVFDRLTPSSELWWLQPGQNNFTVAASGATGSTSVSLSWLPRYRGVLR